MDILDGDTVRLSANGVYAERDIVQFVPYRDSRSWMATICPEIAGKWSSSYDSTSRLAKVKLAKEVLAEIPDQLTGFMKSRTIVPMKRQPIPSTSQQESITEPPKPVSSSVVKIGGIQDAVAGSSPSSPKPSAPPQEQEGSQGTGRKVKKQLVKQSSSKESPLPPSQTTTTVTTTNAKTNHNNNINSAMASAPVATKTS